MTDDQVALGERFERDGYVIVEPSDREALDLLAERVMTAGNKWLNEAGREGGLESLELSHQVVSLESVNSLRVSVFESLNADVTTRGLYFAVGRSALECIVGNELAMQTKVNLSIQQPQDEASVLEIHSDVWTGDSPFQVVLWVPLVDTQESNGMFFLPPTQSYEAFRKVRSGELHSMREVHRHYKAKILSLELNFGQILIFNSNCLHGNQINRTSRTRWSLNSRFVSLLAPSTNPERRLGSYYSPITMRPATRMGLEYLRLVDDFSRESLS